MAERAFQRVLVPVDFSPCSRAAARFAARLLAPHGARIDLLHVYQDPISMSDYRGWWETLDEFERASKSLASWITAHRQGPLNEIAVDVHRLGVADVETHLVEGRPIDAILSFADDYDFDLIVMGTGSASGIRGFLMGSVAERVAHRAEVPVLVVPGASARATPKKE